MNDIENIFQSLKYLTSDQIGHFTTVLKKLSKKKQEKFEFYYEKIVF